MGQGRGRDADTDVGAAAEPQHVTQGSSRLQGKVELDLGVLVLWLRVHRPGELGAKRQAAGYDTRKQLHRSGGQSVE